MAIEVSDVGTGNDLTPVMRQHRAAKDAHPDALIFFRLGDFYELFYEDAVIASRELQLTLTSRDKSKSVPMCGVPFHSAGPYIQRLLHKGYRVALCEQMEDPKATKTIVRREVTRVLTPGTAVDAALDASESQWLASIAATGSGTTAAVGVAAIDLSTGEFRATEFSTASAWPLALDELARMRPSEIIFPRGNGFGATSQSVRQGVLRDTVTEKEEPAQLEIAGSRTEVEDWAFTEDYALPLLRQQLRVHSLDGMGLAHHTAAAVAAGAIVHYLRATKQGALDHLDTLRYYERRDCLELDAVSVRNLELVEPLFSIEGPQTTLFWTLDSCCTPMGKRLLRAQLLRPMQSLPAINARLDAVAEAAADIRRRETLRRSMEGVLDLERLLGRVAMETAGPREVVALGATIARLPNLRSAVTEFATNSTGRWSELAAAFDTLDDLHEIIARTLVDEPPVALSDGGAIREAVDPELDELRGLSSSGRQRIAAIEERERERTGIASLKVRFNSVFGYYLEVTKANAKSVPADYERKQTLVNAERFTTPELKELEVKILTAQERSSEIERRIFAELRRQLLTSAARIREASRHIAEIDLLANFAHLAALRAWVRPTVDSTAILEFINARHPVVERRLEDQGTGRFIPNSLHLSAAVDPVSTDLSSQPNPTSDLSSRPSPAQDLSSRPERSAVERPAVSAPATNLPNTNSPSLLLITGPNMGGKSTYLRQAALLVIMAQCGCFVPAERMHLGLVDRIYTRIGASDNVARGRSTFMVEMTETAAILNTATSRSLVLLDEMGRGTATYDGLSLAWATVEHLHDTIGARTLFATHYHELTLLAERLPHLRNVRVTVRENATGIVFLHTVEPGAASKSYGIEVARLAGLPNAVISRAREVLKVHERAESQQVRESSPTPKAPRVQMTMFTPLSQRIVDRIDQVDIDGLTPREALQLLADLQRELKGGNA
jgi:DNA mismatch repair protein MutS